MSDYADTLKGGNIQVAAPCESALNHIELGKWHLRLLHEEMNSLGMFPEFLDINRMEANVNTVTSMLIVSDILNGLNYDE